MTLTVDHVRVFAGSDLALEAVADSLVVVLPTAPQSPAASQ